MDVNGLAPLQFVYVELTVKCNLRCRFCDNEMRNQYADLPAERFRDIVDQLPPGTKLGLHGLGEPTLHPRLLEMIGWAKARGLYVYFNTNHTLTSDEHMRGFVELELDELRISMSAGTAKGFAAYAGRDSFDALVGRVHRMVAIRGALRKPLLRIVFVLTRESHAEFPAVLRISEEAGVDELQVQSFLDWGKIGTEEDCDLRRMPMAVPELLEARRAMVDAARSATRVRVILPFPLDANAVWNGPGAPGQCQWPFNAMWITADGHATPCCNIHDPRQQDLGKVFGRSLESVRLSEPYQQFRDQYRRNAVRLCESCPVHYGSFKTYTYGRAEATKAG